MSGPAPCQCPAGTRGWHAVGCAERGARVVHGAWGPTGMCSYCREPVTRCCTPADPVPASLPVGLGPPAAGSLCEVCGREKFQAGAVYREGKCYRGYGVGDAADCYRLGYEREKVGRNAAYAERNQVVAAMAQMARRIGWWAGVAPHQDKPGEAWDQDWRTIVFIDLPTGQVSWHFHDSEKHLLAKLPPYPLPWDGHDTAEKYRRVNALASGTATAQPAPSASLSEALTGKEGLGAAAQAERHRDAAERVLHAAEAACSRACRAAIPHTPAVNACWGHVAAAIDAALASEQPRAAPTDPPLAGPLVTFDKLAADRLADEVAVLVRRGIIDSRSPAADALLDYREPPYTARSDRLAELEGRADSAPPEGVDASQPMLLGSSVLPSMIDTGAGDQVQLGAVVRCAHRVSGLTIEAWNALPDADREARLALTVAWLRGQTPSPILPPAGPKDLERAASARSPCGTCAQFIEAAQAERDRWRERYSEAADHLHDMRERPKEALEAAQRWLADAEHDHGGPPRSEAFEVLNDLVAELDGARYVASGFINRVTNEAFAAGHAAGLAYQCGCKETWPQLQPGKINHGPGCARHAQGQAPSASAVPATQMGEAAPLAEYCDRCDGCGWYEGGPTLRTMCERCGGTGLAEFARYGRVPGREQPTAGPPAVPALPSGARQPETEQQIKDLRAAIAASPCVSAEEPWSECPDPDEMADLLDARGYPTIGKTLRILKVDVERLRKDVALYDPAAIVAYAEMKERAAYARGRKELEGALRDARHSLHEHEQTAAIQERQFHGGDREMHAYRQGQKEAFAVAQQVLDRHFGSAAPEAQPPPSPSGALAGAEEMTPKEKK